MAVRAVRSFSSREEEQYSDSIKRQSEGFRELANQAVLQRPGSVRGETASVLRSSAPVGLWRVDIQQQESERALPRSGVG